MARLKKEDLFHQWEDLHRQARDLATTAHRRVQIPSIPDKSYQRTTMQEFKDMIARLRQLIDEWTAEDAQLSEAETALITDTAGVDAVHAHLEEWEAAWADYISKLKRVEDLEAQGRYGYQLRQPKKAVELAAERLYQIDPDMCRRLGIVPISACGQPETEAPAQSEADEYQSMTMEELLLLVLFSEDEECKKAAQAEVKRRNGLEDEEDAPSQTDGNGPVNDSNGEARVTLFTYGSNAFTVPVNRLQRYLDECWDGISVDDFLDFYTWDDAEQVLHALRDSVKLALKAYEIILHTNQTKTQTLGTVMLPADTTVILTILTQKGYLETTDGVTIEQVGNSYCLDEAETGCPLYTLHPISIL